MDKSAQIKALTQGKGIQYLLDAASEILHDPIAMFDTNYALKAYTDSCSDDPPWNELITTGTFSPETQEFFARECFTEEVANVNKLVILKSGKLKYDRIHGNIFNRDHIKVANLVMVGCNAPLGAEEMSAFELLVDKITHEIQNDEYYIVYGRAYHESIINKLLDRIITDPRIYTGHVQILYDNFEDYLYLAVVDTGRAGTHRNKPAYFKDLLESKHPSFKYAIYSGYIVMIMSSKYRKIHEAGFFDKHDNLFEQNNLFVGISNSFENLYELRQYYDEAVAVLKNGIETGGLFIASTTT